LLDNFSAIKLQSADIVRKYFLNTQKQNGGSKNAGKNIDFWKRRLTLYACGS